MKIPHAEVHVKAEQVTKKERDRGSKGEGASSNMISKSKKKAAKLRRILNLIKHS